MIRNILKICAFIFCFNLYAQDLIAVQNGSTPDFYEDLGEAIDNAVSGDTLYLPGKSYAINATINKKLHFIGTGTNPNYTQTTDITTISAETYNLPQFTFETGSGGSSIEGILFSLNNNTTLFDQYNVLISSDLTSLTIRRSRLITGFRSDGSLNVGSIVIIQCVMGRTILGNTTNSLLSNNIFTAINVFSGAVVSNNIFLRNDNFHSPFDSGSENCNVRNNIFYSSTVNSNTITNNIFRNNLNVGINGSNTFGNTGSNNFIDNIDLTSVFENYSGNGNIFNDSYNFRLPDNSPYKNSGSDGTDLGIYGGDYPWKEGAIPFNPHIESKTISSSTDENGNLQVEIQVKAQQN